MAGDGLYALQRGVGGQHPGRQQSGGVLDWQRAEVVVGVVHRGAAVGGDAVHAADAARAAVEAADRALVLEHHAAAGQVVVPGVDPDLAGRAGAGRHQSPDAVGKEDEVGLHQPGLRQLGHVLESVQQVGHPLFDRVRLVGRKGDGWQATQGHHLAAGVDQLVAGHAAVAERRACHGVDDVAVEVWEEAKAVLAQQRRVGRHCGIRHQQAARLAARYRPMLKHGDTETTLNELMRGAHATDAAAEYENAGCHESLPAVD